MRPPDLVIGPVENPYMHRWHLMRWNGWQIALHKIWRSDDDRAVHDHVGDNLSILLWRTYKELMRKYLPAGSIYRVSAWKQDGDGRMYRDEIVQREWFGIYFRKAEAPHRLILDKPVWTLWLRWPSRRQWGFHCPKGWRHWKEYVAKPDQQYAVNGSSEIGIGCD